MKFNKRTLFKGITGVGLSLLTPAAMAKKLTTKGIDRLSSSDEFRICFGSCNLQYKPQEHWNKILAMKPDRWFFIGDNIYANTRDMNEMADKYKLLGQNPHFKKFKKEVKMEAIWDDHDYGEDGANRTYPKKEESQQQFLDFFGVAANDERRSRPGIYHTKEYCEGKVKVYFLDCRYFRDPTIGRNKSLVGEVQWQWLEEEFAQSQALVNLIVSPIGVLLNRLFVTEDWSEFPTEKDRLFELIGKYDLKGTFFLSGDKHFGAAIHRNWKRNGVNTPYYEFQSSGLTHVPPGSVLNLVKIAYGRKNVIGEMNFATIDFDFSKEEPQMNWELQSLEGPAKLRRNFKLDQDGIWHML